MNCPDCLTVIVEKPQEDLYQCNWCGAQIRRVQIIEKHGDTVKVAAARTYLGEGKEYPRK